MRSKNKVINIDGKGTIKAKIFDVLHEEGIGVEITIGVGGVSLSFEGYGNCCSQKGHGSQVFVEKYDGKLQAHVWADINEEEETHSIDLEGSSESRRER